MSDEELCQLAVEGRPADCELFNPNNQEDEFILNCGRAELERLLASRGRTYRKILIRLGDLGAKESAEKYIEAETKLALLDATDPGAVEELEDVADMYADVKDIVLHSSQFYTRAKAFDEQERTPLPTPETLVSRAEVVPPKNQVLKHLLSIGKAHIVERGNRKVLVIGGQFAMDQVSDEKQQALEAGFSEEQADQIVAAFKRLNTGGLSVPIETIIRMYQPRQMMGANDIRDIMDEFSKECYVPVEGCTQSMNVTHHINHLKLGFKLMEQSFRQAGPIFHDYFCREIGEFIQRNEDVEDSDDDDEESDEESDEDAGDYPPSFTYDHEHPFILQQELLQVGCLERELMISQGGTHRNIQLINDVAEKAFGQFYNAGKSGLLPAMPDIESIVLKCFEVERD